MVVRDGHCVEPRSGEQPRRAGSRLERVRTEGGVVRPRRERRLEVRDCEVGRTHLRADSGEESVGVGRSSLRHASPEHHVTGEEQLRNGLASHRLRAIRDAARVGCRPSGLGRWMFTLAGCRIPADRRDERESGQEASDPSSSGTNEPVHASAGFHRVALGAIMHVGAGAPVRASGLIRSRDPRKP